MSDDQPENVAPVLRREALLPSERSRGLGTVAVVCTMAGVASGLALATTLMAMQVADSMSSRSCPYRDARLEARMPVQSDVRSDQGFLGIYYRFHNGYADVISVVPNTPAEAIGLRRGDRVISIDHRRPRSGNEFQQRILGARPGSQPELVVQRDGEVLPTLRPTLMVRPSVLRSAH